MPDIPGKPDASPHERIPRDETRRIEALQKSFGKVPPQLPRGGESNSKNEPRTDLRGLGCQAKTALREWHEFASAHPDFDLTGKREFDSHLARINTIENEEQSLYAFARSKGLDGAAMLLT